MRGWPLSDARYRRYRTAEADARSRLLALISCWQVSRPGRAGLGVCAGHCRDSGSGHAFRPNRQDGLVLVRGDPDDARLKPCPGIVLDVGVRPFGVDPRHDGVHRHRRVPSLGVRQQHSARRITRAGACFPRCPVVYRRRKLGLADERLLRGRQADEDKIGGSKRIAVFLVPADSPHLRPQQRGGLFLIPSETLNR